MKEDTYYSRNREKALEKVKVHREANKSYYKAYYQTWYSKNKDVVNAKRQERAIANPRPVKERPVKEQSVKVKPVKEKPVKEKPVKTRPVLEKICPVDFVVAPVPVPVSTIIVVDHDIIVRFD